MKNLHHDTSIERWQRIVQRGRLNTTQSIGARVINEPDDDLDGGER